MTGFIAFIAVFVPILLVTLRLHRRDQTEIARLSLDQASAFAKDAGLFVPSQGRVIVPRIERILGGEHCHLIDGKNSISIGKVHHRLFDWFSPADQSLHTEKTAIHIETRVQLNPYGVTVTLKDGDLIEGEGFFTPGSEGNVGDDHRMWRADIEWRGNVIKFEPKKVKGIPKGHDVYIGSSLVGSALRIADRIDPRVLLLDTSLPELTILLIFYISSYALGDQRTG